MSELKEQYPTRVEDMLAEVSRFNAEILCLPVPSAPTIPSEERWKFGYHFMLEELDEFHTACKENNIPDAADALVDLIYVALGRLLEMGIPPGPIFREVQRANMEKKRGLVEKRGQPIDAVKPEGWQPPNHEWLWDLTPEIMTAIRERRFLHPNPAPESEPEQLAAWSRTGQEEKVRAEKEDRLDKPQIALIPYEALVAEAAGMAFGAYIKYSPWNWVNGVNYSEVVSSCYHHIAAWFDREVFDPQSKVHHLGLARCNMAMLIAWEAMGRKDLDDRRPAHSVTMHTPTERGEDENIQKPHKD